MNMEKFSEAIKDFLNYEGFEVEVVYNTDFAYDYGSSTIYYALLIPDTAGQLLMNFARQHGLKYDCGSFYLSLLHEVGHHETLDLLDDDEEEYSLKIKKQMGETDKISDILTYFNLPDEIAATKWAINYINNNKEKLQYLSNRLKPILSNIFNEITAKSA